MANSAFGDAERLCDSLLATVSFDDLVYVHAASLARLTFFRLGCCIIRLGR